MIKYDKIWWNITQAFGAHHCKPWFSHRALQAASDALPSSSSASCLGSQGIPPSASDSPASRISCSTEGNQPHQLAPKRQELLEQVATSNKKYTFSRPHCRNEEAKTRSQEMSISIDVNINFWFISAVVAACHILWNLMNTCEPCYTHNLLPLASWPQIVPLVTVIARAFSLCFLTLRFSICSSQGGWWELHWLDQSWSSKVNWKVPGQTSWWSPNLPCTCLFLWDFSDSGMGTSIMFWLFGHVQQLRPASWEVQRTFNHSQSWETAHKRSDVGKNRQNMINALHGRRKHGTAIKHHEHAIWCNNPHWSALYW